ncbi:MAG: DinB family protein [SAR202 cluster bacterium]|nr:DinB family protein [SAR202 cluster bacterium]|tara:strand:- start:198 stop:710 length:513 start_codon:yes stop_codon:yes gene_type:complete
MNYFQLAIKSGLDEYYEILNKSLDTLTQEELIFRPKAHSNSIVFLVWHMAMVEDWLTNEILLNNGKIWIIDKYYEKFPDLKEKRGYGFSQEELDKFPNMDIEWLINYYDVVRNNTNKLLENITEKDLYLKYEFKSEEVTGYFILGRLITELSQHLGQVSYIRGMLRGLNQ